MNDSSRDWATLIATTAEHEYCTAEHTTSIGSDPSIDNFWPNVAAAILATPVPDINCPRCKGDPFKLLEADGVGRTWMCSVCRGSGHATIAQLLVWGQAVAQAERQTIGNEVWCAAWNDAIDCLRSVLP